jgi:CBS domain-containing protein
MRIATLMGDDVVFVAPDATLLDVIDVLASNEIGAVAVGEPDRPVGVLSERDVVHALADRRPIESTRAADIATKELVWCDTHSLVGEVAAEMMQSYVRHVLVERNGRLVGIVSARDLLGLYAEMPS